MLKINQNINGIDVNVEFDSGLYCIDVGDSGTGKTFLINIIKSFCLTNGISYLAFDSEATERRVLSDLGSNLNVEVVLLDNADLYMTSNILALIKSMQDTTFIVSIKNQERLGLYYNLCLLVYKDTELYCKLVKRKYYENSNDNRR